MALLGPFSGYGQSADWKKGALDFQAELNRQYADSAESPLEEADRVHFEGLAFFPVRKAYRVEARVELTPDAVPFEMATVSGKTKTFVKYGVLHFELRGKKESLAMYRNLKLSVQEEYADYLFIPFKDLSSGVESYGGGRYIDFKVPTGDVVVLDLNQCYNPYCAYSSGWNCPIPPEENFLDVKVLAGVRKWDGH